MKLHQLLRLLLSLPLVAVLAIGCGKDTEKQDNPAKTNIRNFLSSEVQLDSNEVLEFFQQYPELKDQSSSLLSFYRKRNYTGAWITKRGCNEYSRNFINLLQHEKQINSTDTQTHANRLFQLYQYHAARGKRLAPDSLADLELLFTYNFFSYARRNWEGGNDTLLKRVNWFIERKRIDYEKQLESFLSNSDGIIQEPVYRQYALLKDQLQRYHDIELLGGWPEMPGFEGKLQEGDSSAVIPVAKRILYTMGDMAELELGREFSAELGQALKVFQERHGLEPDGTLGQATAKAMRVPVRRRIEQILANMERCKWVPYDNQGDYIFVNIPEFKLHVYKDDSLLWSCNVIVGKTEELNNTVIFNDTLEFVVFSPYWNIPKNILSNEVLPAIKNDKKYLVKNNLEVVTHAGTVIDPSDIDWEKYTDKVPFIVREKPGPSNSLGKVKFLFPNPYDIYLHDTPAKTLFRQSTRAFSHGCIRIEQPERLALHLLQDAGWDEEMVREKMNGSQETFIKVKKKVPVFLAYFTCFQDRKGLLHFREDVYGHDQKMREILF